MMMRTMLRNSRATSYLRHFKGSGLRSHGGGSDEGRDRVRVVFVDAKGEETDAEACVGDNILVVAHKNNVDLEGACECSIACSTCHVILDDEVFDELPEPSEEEEDMLDLAFGLTPTYVCFVYCIQYFSSYIHTHTHTGQDWDVKLL